MVPAAAAMQQAVVAMTTVNLPAEKIKVYFDKPQSTSYRRNSQIQQHRLKTHKAGEIKNIQTATVNQL